MVDELDTICVPLNEYIDHTTEVHMKAKNSALYNRLVVLETSVTKHAVQLQGSLTRLRQFEDSTNDLEKFK